MGDAGVFDAGAFDVGGAPPATGTKPIPVRRGGGRGKGRRR